MIYGNVSIKNVLFNIHQISSSCLQCFCLKNDMTCSVAHAKNLVLNYVLLAC